MLRRLVLIGFLSFLSKEDFPISRMVAGAGLSLTFLFAVLVLRPYRKMVDNVLAAIVHMSLMLLLLVLCLIEAYQRSVPRLVALSRSPPYCKSCQG